MGKCGGSVERRARWVGLFTIVLVVTSAVPVLADPSPPPAGEIFWASEEEAELLPDAEDIARGMGEAAQREAEEQAWLETPEAEAERAQSQGAYADLAPSEAKALLASRFSEELALIDQDPARALSDAGLKQVLGPTSARITVEGETLLMEGSMPVRAPEEDGDLAKVDLDLEQSGNGFLPSNPLTEVVLPEQASEGIEVGGSGLAITPDLPEGDSSARPFGEKDLFYPEVETDTDLLAQPIAGGVEVSAQLRSEESPEEVRLTLELPAGANLSLDGYGGAEVRREGERIATVSAPRAFDAQGAEVPVTIRVEGSDLVMDVPHRGGEFAYPVLLDPAIGEDWYNTGKHWYGGANLGALDTPGIWVWTTNNGGRFWAGISTVGHNFGGSGRGLFISANSATGENQPPNKYGQWSYTAPGATTWIAAAGASPFWRYNGSCSVSAHPEPHDFAGLWSPTWSPEYGWITFRKNDAHNLGHTYHTPPQYPDWREKLAQVFIIGMGSGNGGPKIPCWRHIYAGGVYVWLDDGLAPSLSPPTGAPASQWVNNSAGISLGVSASDTGLGVQNIELNNSSGGNAPLVNQNVCTGLKQNPCPASMNGQITVTAALFKEGERPASVIAKDPTGKVSTKYEWQMKVDNTAPTIDLDGQLAKATEEDEGAEQGGEEVETLSLPVYSLQIDAKDGSTGKPEDKRSGVKSLAVHLDGKEVPEAEWTQPCPASSCPMSRTFTLRLPDLAAGEHTLEVVAKDQLNEPRVRPIKFEYTPATGMKDEYVMHYFPLPDGLGNEEEEEFPSRPELAVNVMNGNLVYRERDIDVEGYAVDLEVERYYNSQFPEEGSTEWGDGWTLAQTPELEPEEGSGPPEEAELLDASGALDAEVSLPTDAGEEEFDPELQATLTKEAGGYELSDETGETSTDIAFDANGRTEELRTDGYAKVDYDYTGDALSEIAVEDPGSLAPTEGVEEPAPVAPTYSSSFGVQGAGNGQLKTPADVALDAQGNLWVADRANHRVQKFSPSGEYLAQFGSQGSGNGQLSSPSALVIDAQGHIWVADTGNHRIQEFSASGQYLSKFGVTGVSDGQLFSPEGIAIDLTGNIWVSSGVSSFTRLQKFSPQGAFIERIGSYGSNPGQLAGPKGIDIDPEGNVWVAEWLNSRVSVFNEAGDYQFQFGSQGSGDGQFSHPGEVQVGEDGVWVGDSDNDRIQRFDSEGSYLAKFGSAGSGPEQLNLTYPTGIATDEGGRLWVTDTGNNRVQEWLTVPDRDPAVEVDIEGGLVSSLKGEAAGEHFYEHEGELLTSHEGPEGETLYEYDAEGRLERVELANDTWAEIGYDSTSRVESVEVDPAGSDPATAASFVYDDANRRTTVVAPPAPSVRYEYDPEDGSVFKWQNVPQPPTIDNLAGSFYAFKETATPISVGDHNLVVTGHSFEGVKSVEIVANGDQLVDEKTCDEDLKTPEVECQSVELGWTTYTGNIEPGRFDLEVIVTDYSGHEASEKFWVNIPHTPPDVPGGVVEPHFEEVLEFREEHGLDLDLEGDEEAIEDRIHLSLYHWANGDPVARSSMERWGAPLFPKDVAELEDRLADHERAAIAIPEWAEKNAPSSYADFYVEEPDGGLIYVGFTGNQAAQVGALKAAVAPSFRDRIVGFPTPPTDSISQLEMLEGDIFSIADQNPGLGITSTMMDSKANMVIVGSSAPVVAASYLNNSLGPQEPFSVEYRSSGPQPRAGRERIQGPIQAGDRFVDDSMVLGDYCTSGFGAWEQGRKPSNGRKVKRYFMLTAAHCVTKNVVARRRNNPEQDIFQKIGITTRRGWHAGPGYETDAAAIKLESRPFTPRYIYTGTSPKKVKGAIVPWRGMEACQSGVTSDDVRCGVITHLAIRFFLGDHLMYQVAYDEVALRGDSGGPVWWRGTNSALGLITAGEEDEEEKEIAPSYFTPLKSPPGKPNMPGIFKDPNLTPLHLFTVEK